MFFNKTHFHDLKLFPENIDQPFKFNRPILLTSRYYYTQDILYDHELQNFANELSADGVGSTGGVGMVGIPVGVKSVLF
jgi:hypothetical protein